MKLYSIRYWIYLLISIPIFVSQAASSAVENAIYRVDKDLVVVVIQERLRVPGPQVPYLAFEDDYIREDGFLFQDEIEVGLISGKYKDRLNYADSIVGRKLDPEKLDDEKSYSITINGKPVGFKLVGRQTKPTDLATLIGWDLQAPYEHRIYLKLEQQMRAGDIIQATFPNSLPLRRVWEHNAKSGSYGTDGPVTDTVEVEISPMKRSPAVQVNHLGFRPADPLKRGYVGLWLGNGGKYSFDDREFQVRKYPSGKVVRTGNLKTAVGVGSPESTNGVNHTGTNVYHCDFSSLSEQGTYVLSVDGIGCSYPFEIKESVWLEPLKTVIEGFYTQRSGIELGPPESRYVRPRPFHPDDGLVVYLSTTPLMDTKNGLNALGTDTSNFGNLLAGRTDEILENPPWGGYFDAGDWDRRIQHLYATRQMLELYEFFPEKLEGMLFDLPETGNGIPDVLNEALFNIDFYWKLQTPEGGVRGGIESEEHPERGEKSWQESLEVLTYAPGVWSSYVFAGTAAQINPLLKPFDGDHADELLESAIKAWNWAEVEMKRLEKERESIPDEVYSSRLLAALQLFRATGNPQFHEAFLGAAPFANGVTKLWNNRQEEAAFYYTALTEDADPKVSRFAYRSFLDHADAVLKTAQMTGYGWALKNGNESVTWGKSICVPPDTLARAHYLTGKASYLKALIHAAQYGAGANPYNQCMVTAVGHDYPRHPLVSDTQQSANPPPGIMVYGPIEPRNYHPWFLENIDKSITPAYLDWPLVHNHWDMWWMVPVNEYTMHETMGPTFYGWGYLGLYE